MQDRHLADVVALEHRCGPASWSIDAFAKCLGRSDSFCTVLVDESGKATGYVVAQRFAEHVHVMTVAVDPTLRRQGYGTALIETVCKWARNEAAETVTLEVRSSNVAATTLYDAAGFTVAGTRPKYYRDGEDATIMTLPLSTAAVEGEE